MMPSPEHANFVSTCAGCGATTTALDTWVRLHDTLLCLDCQTAIAHNAAEAEVSLTSAEREWVRFWRELYDALADAA